MEQDDINEEQVKLIHLVERFFKKPVDASTPVLLTTQDIFQKLQSIYPGEYVPTDIYMVLTYLKFETVDSTTNKIYWLIQEQPLQP